VPARKKPANSAKQLKRVRTICLSLPDVTEKFSHGEPTFFVQNRVFTVFSNNHHGDGHIAALLPAADGLQQALIEEAPATYYRPPYVGHRGWIGIELSQVNDEVLAAHIREACALILAKSSKARRARSG
jgi:hypothetical protein